MNSENGLTVRRRIARKLKVRQIQAAAASLTARCIQNYWMPGSKRVLFIEDLVPHSSLGAGFPRSNRILSEMVRMGLLVTLYPASAFFESWSTLYQDIPLKVEIILGQGLAKLEQFLRGRPDYYDLLYVSRPHNMAVIDSLLKKSGPLDGIKIVYDAEAIFSLREIGRSQHAGQSLPPQHAKRLVSEEVGLAKGSHSVVCVSEIESRIFADHGFTRIFTLGHAIEPSPTPGSFDLRKDILFVGAILGETCPNLESVTWFSQQVLPILRKKLHREDPKLLIAGADSGNLANRLSGVSVEVLGRVDNLRPLYNSVRIFVAPTRFAAGIPLKVYEASAHGVPVVTTSLIASKLGWRNGIDLLVADDEKSFADACSDLYLDRELWNRLRSNALDRVRRDCSPEAFSNQLRHIIKETVGEI